MNFDERRIADVDRIEQILKEYLPDGQGYQHTVLEAMDYSVMAGGKRLRPMLILETYRLFAGEDADTRCVEPFMAAMEMLHTYSLVHDDLPAMDDDEYRRGRKTTHVVYGEAMGILAGDALLNYAFETALRSADYETDYRKVLSACQIFAGKAGVFGMIGGQVVDVEAEKHEHTLSQEELMFVYENKTAALIEASMMIGAVMAGADHAQLAICERIGYLVGIAFQIQDDILDITGSFDVLGKPIGSDLKNDKQTYVSICGMVKSKEKVEELYREAVSLLDSLPVSNPFLNELLIRLITREK